ncbi:MAG: peptide deformylase [Microbacteriaceae bacterium]|nr:peptide deformylase [Microbacteriaceae bacterium]
MRIREIAITGEPVLHRPAARVERFDDDLRDLVTDMFATMELAPGVGLAAPQIGEDRALFVYDWVDDDERQHRGVAINPTIMLAPLRVDPVDEDEELEGCLSVPGERFPLRRSDRAILTAWNVDGNEFTVDAEGWLARIFQHEYDHLRGILYNDRLVEPFFTEARDAIHREGWGKPGFSWLPGRDHPEG